MRVNVKLYGTLSLSFDQYDHLNGLDAVLPDGASIQELLAYLKISPDRLGMIYMDGKLLDVTSQLKDGARISIFRPVAGG